MRAATSADAPAVHALTQAAYAEYAGRLDPPSGALAETVEQVAAELAHGGGLVLPDTDGSLLGALRLRRGERDPRELWVRRVCVPPAARRRGVASALLAATGEEALQRGAGALRLGVRHALPGNRRLYERAGWVIVRRHAFWDELGRPLPRLVRTPAAMRDLGDWIGREVLQAGDLLLLDGALGAGKTVLAQGVARGLGVRGPVTSPTYTLADVHTDGRLPLLHLDAWRLAGPAELDDLDLDVDPAVTVVEWGVGRAEQLAAEHLVVRIAVDDDDSRRVSLTPSGPGWAARLVAAGLL